MGERKKKAKTGEENMILTSETQFHNEKQRRHDVILSKVAPLYIFFQAGLT